MELVRIAQEYKEEHNIHTDEGFVFSLTNEPLKYSEVNELFKKYCKRLGIPYRSSHKARKTYISSLLDGGVNINTVRKQVGHADERTTYKSYCFDPHTDKEREKLIENALT